MSYSFEVEVQPEINIPELKGPADNVQPNITGGYPGGEDAVRAAAASGVATRSGFVPSTGRAWAAGGRAAISSAPRNLASSSSWTRGQTPAACQSRRRFHSVMPQQPISQGKSSQGMPVFNTKMIPASATRSTSASTGSAPAGRGR